MTVERRVYTKEFKEQAVLLTETSGKKVGGSAQELGIQKTTFGAGRKNFVN